MADRDLTIALRAQDLASGQISAASANIKASLGSVQGVSHNLAGKFKDMWGSMVSSSQIALGVVTGVAAGIGAALGKMAMDANTANIVQAKFEYMMKEVAGATNEQTAALQRVAEAQMRKTGIDDEAIKNGMSMLATFKLSTDQISRMTPSLINMASALSDGTGGAIDLRSAAILLGKSTGGELYSALTRVGVIFTENQKKALENADAEGRLQIITKELGAEFGNVAEAMYAGDAFGRFNMLMGEMGESIGKLVLNWIKPFIDTIGDVVDVIGQLVESGGNVDTAFSNLEAAGVKITPIMRQVGDAVKWIQENGDTVKTVLAVLAGVIVGAVLPALISMAVSAIAATLPLLPLMAVCGLLAAAWINNWGGIKEKTEVVINALKPVLEGLGNALMATFNWLVKHGDIVVAVLAGIGVAILVLLVPAMIAWIASIWATTVALLACPLTWIVLAIVAIIAAVVLLIMHWKEVWKAVSDFVNFCVREISKFVNMVIRWFQDMNKKVTKFWMDLLKPVVDVFNKIKDFIASTIGAVINWFQRKWDEFCLIIRIAWIVAQIVFSQIANYVSGVWNSIVSWCSGAINNIANFFRGLWNSIASIFSGIYNTIAGWIGSAANWINNTVAWIRNIFWSIVNAVAGVGQSIWNTLTSWIGGVANWIWSKIQSIIGWFGNIGGQIKTAIGNGLRWMGLGWLANMIGFQMGGYVWETGPAILHKGERVIPANEVENNYNSAPVINISGDIGMGNKLAYIISKELDRQNKNRIWR